VIEVSLRTSASAQDVWAVLADGWMYAAWVVGAARIRAVDAGWPGPHTKIHHSAGSWPVLLNDETEVLSADPPNVLVMQARGWPAGEARVEVRVTPTGSDGCSLRLREDVTHGVGLLVPRPLRKLAFAPRNVESLRRLAYLAEGRSR
jgi:hypothetical protein